MHLETAEDRITCAAGLPYWCLVQVDPLCTVAPYLWQLTELMPSLRDTPFAPASLQPGSAEGIVQTAAVFAALVTITELDGLLTSCA